MRVVHKVPLQVGVNEIPLPNGTKILKVETQGGTTFKEEACMWYEFDEDKQWKTELREFQVFGTGHPIPDGLEYVGTFQLQHGRFIGHLYERPREQIV